MSSWKITLFASDNPDAPTDDGADHGEMEFYVLSLMPFDEAAKEPSRKADNTLENNIPQRGFFEVEFLPFYVSTAIYDEQDSIQQLILLKKMLKQPYLVIKSCTLLGWADGPNNLTAEYELPVVVRWDYQDGSASNKDDGTVEYSARLEILYPKGTTQPTPVTNTAEYTY